MARVRAVSARTLLVIAGPTGVGKSRLAVEVARSTGAEIVSADSRQVYRGLDIGTATPTAEERRGVPHHLLDVVDPGVRVSAGWFVDRARAAIEAVWASGRDVVVVGGSTLYVHALVEGLAPLPSLRADLEQDLTRRAASPEGRRQMFDELERLDPSAASTLDSTKSQRLVRLLGLVLQTGRRASDVWHADGGAPFASRLVVLDRPRPELYARIDARVTGMVARGLVDEAEWVLDRWPDARSTLEATIGYRELLPVFDGTSTLAEAVALIQRNSRRYAKRQRTWYRRYPDAVWLDAATATLADVRGL